MSSSGVTLKPGESMYLALIADNTEGCIPMGKPPKTGTFNYGGKAVTLVNGFFCTNPSVGSITVAPSGSGFSSRNAPLCIKYTQLAAADNVIYFVAQDGDIGTFKVGTPPLHDHTSVYEGGPAHSTYATNYKKP